MSLFSFLTGFNAGAAAKAQSPEKQTEPMDKRIRLIVKTVAVFFVSLLGIQLSPILQPDRPAGSLQWIPLLPVKALFCLSSAVCLIALIILIIKAIIEDRKHAEKQRSYDREE